ncbi:MAG: AbrB/MazE/SpoVT family DNA-binding domain-containing protein [Candidatus Kaiserbacteria bacterium]|nr:AbrB/MazE/SpoVT family DNA-binding domain-containing protein [Candidatus Kaiserbacteria bacterium]
MNTTTIQKWGNSYAVRLPKVAMDKLNLRAGHPVEIREMVKGQTLSIIPVRHRAASLSEMIARITKKNRHNATDWGDSVGKEVW